MPDREVLVVGAGPTGLLLAAELVRRGVDCELIDAHDAPLGWDRATIVHSRSMQIFEALGLADRFAEEGIESPRVRLLADGRELGILDFSTVDTPYAYDLGISEDATEEIITEHLEGLGGGVVRGIRLTGLEQDAAGVTATLEHDGEEYEQRAGWVVGCDGYHSSARRLTGIEYPGRDIERQWAVFDATLDGWTQPLEIQVAHLDERPVILTPLPEGRWRVYMRPSPDGDLVEEAMETVNRYAPDVSAVDVENPVRFDCHSRIASSYRAGRVLLAGDAAHACTPAQGHGMNTGLQDAFNLGWKLALVVRGEADAALLDSYELERRPVAELVIGSGDDAEATQAVTGEVARAERNQAIAATFADLDAGHHEAVAGAELNRSYAGSPIVAGDESDAIGPGDLLPETAPVGPADGQPRPLHALTHRAGHTVLVLGGPAADPAEVLSLTEGLESEHAGSSVVDAVVGLCADSPSKAIGTLGPDVADQLGIEGIAVLAVRPDRFVGLRRDGADAGAVPDYLATLTT